MTHANQSTARLTAGGGVFTRNTDVVPDFDVTLELDNGVPRVWRGRPNPSAESYTNQPARSA